MRQANKYRNQNYYYDWDEEENLKQMCHKMMMMSTTQCNINVLVSSNAITFH